MANHLDEFDLDKLKEAKKLILEVYESNYIRWSSLTKRLDTILNKIISVINSEQSKV